MSQYNLSAARKKDQLERMIELQKNKICAFCPENISEATDSPIEIETKHWLVKKNDYPYDNTSYHLLVIPKKHVKTISDLTKVAKAEFLDLISQVESKYKFKSYALGMRSGDMRFNGGSVEHLHAQVIVGKVTKVPHEPVRFKMSSQPK